VHRGLVHPDDMDGGQVGITGLDGSQERGLQAGAAGADQNALDPLFEGTRWTQEDVRTLSSLATLLVATIALWEVIR